MARSVDPTVAWDLLSEGFQAAEANFLNDQTEPVPPEISVSTKRAFSSNTGAYRQALLGCVIAHAVDPLIDIRLPHTQHGDDAFSGRTLDEGIVIPFLEERGVPFLNAYLSSLRRGVRFINGGVTGQRDRDGFSALVSAVDAVSQMSHEQTLQYLRFLLGLFVVLREQTGPVVPAQIRAPIKVAWNDDLLIRIEVAPDSPDLARADGRLSNYEHLQEELEELSAILDQNNAARRITDTLSRYQRVLGTDFKQLDVIRLGLLGISLHHAASGSKDSLSAENHEQITGFLVAHDLFVSKDGKWVEYRRSEAIPMVSQTDDLAALPAGQQIIENMGQLEPFMESSITEILSESKELSTQFSEEPLFRDGFWKSLGNVLIALFERAIDYARTDVRGFISDFASDLRKQAISQGSKTVAALIIGTSVTTLAFLSQTITGYHWISGALEFLKLIASKVL